MPTLTYTLRTDANGAFEQNERRANRRTSVAGISMAVGTTSVSRVRPSRSAPTLTSMSRSRDSILSRHHEK